MSAVLLLTISYSSPEQQFRQYHYSCGLRQSDPGYAFAVISCRSLGDRLKKMQYGRTFIIYATLSLIGLGFIMVALTGAGTKPLFWGMVLQMFTIPLYLFLLCAAKNTTDLVRARPVVHPGSALSRPLRYALSADNDDSRNFSQRNCI